MGGPEDLSGAATVGGDRQPTSVRRLALGAAEHAVRGARDVARLVVPVRCPGCGRWDELLCADCAVALDHPPTRCEADVPRLDHMDGGASLPVWRVARYAPPARGIVVGWKDGGRADLTPVLVACARRAAVALAPLLAQACAGEGLRVVPVPSSPGARRRRGADLVGLLSRGVVAGLRAGGVDAEVAPVLARRRGGRDQVGLGARDRGRNTAGSVDVRRGSRNGPGTDGRLHLLVDDVVTTGSTLATCEAALLAAGALVLGAVVLAATPPPASPHAQLLKVSDGD